MRQENRGGDRTSLACTKPPGPLTAVSPRCESAVTSKLSDSNAKSPILALTARGAAFVAVLVIRTVPLRHAGCHAHGPSRDRLMRGNSVGAPGTQLRCCLCDDGVRRPAPSTRGRRASATGRRHPATLADPRFTRESNRHAA